MKNKLVLIAVLALGFVTTGCGPIGESAENAENSTVNEESAVTEAEEKTTETMNTENTESAEKISETVTDAAVTEKASESSAADYEKPVRDYYEALNNNDSEAVVRLMYPEKFLKALSSASDDGEMPFLTGDSRKYEITDISLVGPMSDETKDIYMQLFDQMAYSLDKLEEYGGSDNLTDEQREELYSIFAGLSEPGEDIERTYKAAEGYDVTVKYNVDGEADEDYFFVFNVEGEGWKVNNSMRKFAKKAQQMLPNSMAKSMFNTVQTVLFEMETSGTDLSGQFIISSDEKLNFNVSSSFDMDEYNKVFEKYTDDYTDLREYDYFVYVNNGSCEYEAVIKKDGTGNTGTYPAMTVPSSCENGKLITETVNTMDGYDFNGIYEKVKEFSKH